jgi:hypothetical protein
VCAEIEKKEILDGYASICNDLSAVLFENKAPARPPLGGPQTSFSSCKMSNLPSTRNVLSDPSGIIMQD